MAGSTFRRKTKKHTLREQVGRFLGYYTQYDLEDLMQMDVDTYWFLVGGMLDCTNPELTEPTRDRISRLAREKTLEAHERFRKRRR